MTEPARAEFLLYQTEDGQSRIEVRMTGETVWLSLLQMSELFGRDKSVISRHIKNLFEERELLPGAVVANFATTAADGKAYQVDHYNLDVIISVGYRVKSRRGTQFRIWATQRLREYLIKGFVMDDERLKAAGGGRYFDELLARIRDIRSSEKVFWRKVLEIYATSIDYDPGADASQQFFATVQNKMHWAAHGHTAAEVIARRADAGRPHMGLTSWQGPSAQDRCGGRQELPGRRRAGHAQPHRHPVPRLRRTAGRESQGHDHDRLDSQTRRLSAHLRARHPHARRQGQQRCRA